MKKSYLLLILFFIFFLTGCSSNFNKSGNSNSSTNLDSASNPSSNNNNSISYNMEKLFIKKPVEEIIYSFSTQILDTSEGRQNNIRLTCSSLNGTIVNSGATFSFCDTVGPATTDKGYKEAKIFGSDGEVTMGLGGGNCQVSSTLYNAVLQDTNFEIVERHPHARKSLLC